MIFVGVFLVLVVAFFVWRRYSQAARRVKDHVMPQMMLSPTPRRRTGPMKSERL